MKLLKAILFCIPFIWSAICIPIFNRVEPLIFGLPFIVVWELVGVVLVSVCAYCIYSIDHPKKLQQLK